MIFRAFNYRVAPTTRTPINLMIGTALIFLGLSLPHGAAASDLTSFGSALFSDKSLSRNNDVSCASCHQPQLLFMDGRPAAVGTGGQHGTRNAPSLLNLPGKPLLWDGRADTLEEVVLQPFTNAAEMGLRDDKELLSRIASKKRYQDWAAVLRSENHHDLTTSDIADALSSFVRSLPRGTSAYEQYRGGNTSALSPSAKRGMILFEGTAGCVDCHRSDKGFFSDYLFHSTLIAPDVARKLPDAAMALSAHTIDRHELNFRIESERNISELGRYVVTHDPKDIGAFRTPPLRNVARTGPYMHDGKVTSLRTAVDQEIYYRSLHSNRPSVLTEDDRQALVAFLESLTSQ